MPKRDKPFNNPFQKLTLDRPARPEPPTRAQPRPVASREQGVEDEGALFLESVGPVTPLKTGARRVQGPPAPDASAVAVVTDEMEALAQLNQLVAGEGNFDLAGSDEHVEAWQPGLDPRLVRRLRDGDFAVQAHVDLHGLTRIEAKAALEAFILSSRKAGRRCVLVVTGRGLHSREQLPVLKEEARVLLARGRLAREVLAFTSARPKDGGLGALYVLLRR